MNEILRCLAVRQPPGRWAIARSVYFPGEWPPYIEGAISLLSTDLIQYVYINRDWLKPLGHLEDVSMGMWLLGLQVCGGVPVCLCLRVRE